MLAIHAFARDRSSTGLGEKREAHGRRPELPPASSLSELTDTLAHQGPHDFPTWISLVDGATVHPA